MQKKEVGRRESEVGRRELEVGSQKSGDEGWNTGVEV